MRPNPNPNPDPNPNHNPKLIGSGKDEVATKLVGALVSKVILTPRS